MPKKARRKGSRRERVETAWFIVSTQPAYTGLIECAYILRLASEAHQRAFPRIQVLGGGYGCREKGEGTAQNFEARIYHNILATTPVLAVGVCPYQHPDSLRCLHCSA